MTDILLPETSAQLCPFCGIAHDVFITKIGSAGTSELFYCPTDNVIGIDTNDEHEN